MLGEMQEEDENWKANIGVPLPGNPKQCQDALVQAVPRQLQLPQMSESKV